MEGFIILITIFCIFFIFVLPGMVFSLIGRVGKLEDENKRLRVLILKNQKEVPSKAVPEVESEEEERSFEEVSDSVLEKKEKELPRVTRSVSPPDLPVMIEEEAKEEEVRAVEPVVTAPPTVKFRPSTAEVLLEKVGLKPPSPDDEGANPMAWWSTRIGLVFGVITAVFLGMYVNQNTVPWVRLLQLVSVALAVFGGGCWLERKLENFGRAISAGGLALLFVAAYAAYGLPAMKVITSPLMGTLAQAVALAFTAAWALWRGREAIFGLALVLGYVTCSFSASEGLDSVPLIALFVLSFAGSVLFAWRNWWSGLWGAVLGSGLGLAVLAMMTWSPASGPSLWEAQGAMLGLTVLPLVALCYRWLKGEKQAKNVVVFVTSVGLLSGAVVTALRGFDFEVFYASFGILLLLAGWWWRRDEGEGLWQALWAKAMVLLALFVIARFDGPVRGFSLLAQAGGLLWLSRTRQRLVFEVGAALAALVGWCWLWADSSLTDQWWGGRGFLLLYLVVSQVLMILYRCVLGEDLWRRFLGVFLTVLVAAGVVYVCLWQEENLWLILAPLLFGVLSLCQRWPLRLKDAEWPLFAVLIGTWLALYHWNDGWVIPGQSAVWLACSGAFYAWLGRSLKFYHLLAMMLLLVGFLFAFFYLVEGMQGELWMPLAFMALALGWHVVGSRFSYFSLSCFSLLAGGAAIWFLYSRGWEEQFDWVVCLTLLVALGYWIWGWRNPEKEESWQDVAEGCRTVFVGLSLWALVDTLSASLLTPVLVVVFSSLFLVAWCFLRAASLVWLGLASAVWAVILLSSEARHSLYLWVIALFFLLFVVNGIWLTRKKSFSAMAQPKVASVLWGGASMVLVLVGLTLVPQMADWTTAAWVIAAVVLLVAGFWFGLRGYRVLALGGLAVAIIRLFVVDIQDSFWRIVAFGVTSALLVGIGYLYNRFNKRLAEGDLDWRTDG